MKLDGHVVASAITFGLVALGLLAVGLNARATKQKVACAVLTDGMLVKPERDTLYIATGVGYALRIDTVVVRSGHVIRVMDCGF